MSQETELYRLEQIVEKLIVKYEDLKAENRRLNTELNEKKVQLADLEESLSIQKSERGEIGKRVSRLVEQIEEWEKTIDSSGEIVDVEASSEEQMEEDEDPEPEQTFAAEVVEGGDAEVVEAAADGKRPEEESRVQHNLFSMSGYQR